MVHLVLSELDDPNEEFDLVAKLGEGAYGSVFKGIHKKTGTVTAIKHIPVGSDVITADIHGMIKEIGVMMQLKCDYIVQYYGSYYHENVLWIVMEYCGAGSIGDIMRMRKKCLNEAEIQTVMLHSLLGLKYLHDMKKIHRDIKSCNILLNDEGIGKLADFGVAGELSDEVSKRSTVIGTPFWMAPEVIQELGHDSKCDIWSLGVTCIELAEGRPPFSEFHPLRAIFMIPSRPPSTLKNKEKFSKEFNDFIASCLIKNADERPDADRLLEHVFIKGAKAVTLADTAVAALRVIEEKGAYYSSDEEESDDCDDDDDDDDIGGDCGTMVYNSDTMVDSGTMVYNSDTMVDSGTMVFNSDTMVDSGTMVYNSDTMVDSGTMVYNSDTMVDSGTMVCNSNTMVESGTMVNKEESQQERQRRLMDEVDDNDYDTGTMVNTGTMVYNDNKGGKGDKGDKNELEIFCDMEDLQTLSIPELKRRIGLLPELRDAEIVTLKKKYEVDRSAINMAKNKKLQKSQKN